MIDIDKLLRHDAEQWNAHRPVEDEELIAVVGAALSRGPRPSRLKPILAVAAAVLVAISMAVAATLIARNRQSTARPPVGAVTGQMVSTRLGNLVIRHPVSWHSIVVERRSLGIDSPLGWLMNQRVHRQCIVSNLGRSLTCHSPAVRLAPGGVYVAAVEVGHLAPPLHNSRRGSVFVFHPNMTVDGHPAELTDSIGVDHCPANTTNRLSLIIAASVHPTAVNNGVTDLIACTSHPTANTTAAVRLALTTVHLSH